MQNNIGKFQDIIARLTGAHDTGSLCGLNLFDLFLTCEDGDLSRARNLSAAFLIALSGTSGKHCSDALDYMKKLHGHPSSGKVADFLLDGLDFIDDEISSCCRQDAGFLRDLNELHTLIENPEDLDSENTIDAFCNLFFPEGKSLLSKNGRDISDLRDRRKIRLTALNPLPIADPAGEILFTSNVMITVPLPGVNLSDLSLTARVEKAVESALLEDQFYWYDHPIPIGIEADRNEAVYGMRGLEEAIRFETLKGNVREDDRATCLLSVSTTHEGLREIAKDYLETELLKTGGLEHLDIFMLTEADTFRLAEEVLIPAMNHYLRPDGQEKFRKVFGVDGKYGRHYSFLKAIAPLWKVLVNPEVRGTFKIDLDQVFPQERLVEETGLSAFEHFMTPLWGAEGLDWENRPVELGMIAGALVNESDIEQGLFTPDVRWPSDFPSASTPTSTSTSTITPTGLSPDQWVFFSKLPQALSTAGEMMLRYSAGEMDGEMDGQTQCIQRIHITGGTTGILIDSLRRNKPFTPTFIGRAEDQAYLMSVLFAGVERDLRYAHAGGLIMRHDKEAFAGEAIEAAHLGKEVGDLSRTLLFTSYARSLPWPVDRIKDLLDPFTGCFISRMPVTVVYLRLALKTATLFATGLKEDEEEGLGLLELASRNLPPLINMTVSDPEPLKEEYLKEKDGWDMYYDVLDELEKALEKNDPFAMEMREKVREILGGCRVDSDGKKEPGDRSQ